MCRSRAPRYNPRRGFVDLVLVLARAVLPIRAQHVDELADRDAHLLKQ